MGDRRPDEVELRTCSVCKLRVSKGVCAVAICRSTAGLNRLAAAHVFLYRLSALFFSPYSFLLFLVYFSIWRSVEPLMPRGRPTVTTFTPFMYSRNSFLHFVLSFRFCRL